MKVEKSGKKLKTIYCNNSWTFSKVEGDIYNFFVNCYLLKGGNNTSYNSSLSNAYRYARVDGGSSNPGFFTRKNS